MLSACSSTPSTFPGQLPNQGVMVTDVSSSRAFHDDDVKVPVGARVVKYAADSGLDAYPVKALLAMPCGAVSGFVAVNSLSVSSFNGGGANSDVEVLAAQLSGWTWNGDPSTRYYARDPGGDADLQVLVTGSGKACDVYLTANQPLRRAGRAVPGHLPDAVLVTGLLTEGEDRCL